MVFKEVGKELPEQWKPKKAGDFIEGTYAQKKENVGKNKANLYIIKTNGVLKAIWGSTVLDDKMVYIKIGDRIRITFKGLEKNYHNYIVEKDELEEPKTSED